MWRCSKNLRQFPALLASDLRALGCQIEKHDADCVVVIKTLRGDRVEHVDLYQFANPKGAVMGNIPSSILPYSDSSIYIYIYQIYYNNYSHHMKVHHIVISGLYDLN